MKNINKLVVTIGFALTAFSSWSAEFQCGDHVKLGIPSQSSQLLCREGYAAGYNYDTKVSDWVSYRMTETSAQGNVTRTNKFAEDKDVPVQFRATLADYHRSGYDRGHQAPAADMRSTTTTMKESFLLTNMTPQLPELNRGAWRILEEKARQWARTSLGLTPGADVKGYRQAVVKLQADTEKAIGQIRRDSMLSQEEKETAIAAERNAAQQQAQGLRDVFGLEALGPAANTGSKPSPSGLTQWVGKDALRREFVNEARANGKPITEHADPAMLDQIYSRWVQLRQDRQTANALRGGYTPRKVSVDPRAAEKVALNALVEPFKNTPLLEKAPDGLAAYKSISVR